MMETRKNLCVTKRIDKRSPYIVRRYKSFNLPSWKVLPGPKWKNSTKRGRLLKCNSEVVTNKNTLH